MDIISHLVNPLVPWLDIALVHHLKPKSIKFDVTVAFISVLIFHGIQILSKFVVFGYYQYGFLDFMSYLQIFILYATVFVVMNISNFCIFRPLVGTRV